ncbi:hypothetical protein AbraIFM66950_007105 [Aspergillus brasiliensis]|nr:hypothetical protein AbraIFM66950_007105 [Aspergillus brasiliensis]
MPLTSSHWLSGQRAGLISLGSHCIYLSADEPERSISKGRLQPAVIIEAGLGSGLSKWVAGIEPPRLGDSTYYEVVGLDQNHAMLEEEYEVIKTDEKWNLPTAQIEESYMAERTKAINDALPEGCCILGDKRLSVIFANESWLYDWWTWSWFIYAEGKARTYNLQYVTPGVIRDEIFWVLRLEYPLRNPFIKCRRQITSSLLFIIHMPYALAGAHVADLAWADVAAAPAQGLQDMRVAERDNAAVARRIRRHRETRT